MEDAAQNELVRAFKEAAGQAMNDTLTEEDAGVPTTTFTAPASDGIETTGNGATEEGQGDTAPKGSTAEDGTVAKPAAAKTSDSDGALQIATSVLESGLGIVPLALDLFHIFDGGSTTQETFTKYAMPDQIDFVGDSSEPGDTVHTDFGQSGSPRDYSGTPDGHPDVIPPAAPTVTQDQPAQPGPQTSPQSTPQTLGPQGTTDPQWFTDNAAAIAAAVRSQMLNLSSINDMITDL
jgi:hypothetical protein